MDGYKFLKPKDKDMIVRDPISKVPLSQNGEFKAWIGREGTFWKRRVNDGTVVVALPPSASISDIKKGGK